MKEIEHIRFMVLLGVGGSLVSAGLGFLFARPDPVSWPIAFAMGALAATSGYILICLQFQSRARFWILYSILGYLLRMGLYALFLVLALWIKGNPFLFLAGFLCCRFSLYLFHFRR